MKCRLFGGLISLGLNRPVKLWGFNGSHTADGFTRQFFYIRRISI